MHHYLRFVRALGVVGTASLAACDTNSPTDVVTQPDVRSDTQDVVSMFPDITSTGMPCSLEGQPCTAYGSTPGPTSGAPPCCYCAALPVDSGSSDAIDAADNDALADSDTDATLDSDAADVVADPGVPGVYHSYCIGPLTPPETSA
jgi:hypothetical protein